MTDEDARAARRPAFHEDPRNYGPYEDADAIDAALFWNAQARRRERRRTKTAFDPLNLEVTL